MKIFVGYAFRDIWVKDYVIPLVQSYGVEVLTGEDLPGQPLDEGVKQQIKSAEAVITFLTRITPTANSAVFKPSDWVVQELTYADANGKKVLDVREDGVEFSGALTRNYQRYTVDPSDRAPFLVRLGQAISAWRSGLDMRLQLVSDDFRRAILPVLVSKNYDCKCVVRRGPDVLRGPEPVTIHRERQGLFVYAKSVPPDSLIEIEVGIAGTRWVSAGTAVDSLDILLEKEP